MFLPAVRPGVFPLKTLAVGLGRARRLTYYCRVSELFKCDSGLSQLDLTFSKFD